MEWKYPLFRWMLTGFDLLFPPVCGGCNRAGFIWCPACSEKVRVLPEPVCRICGCPLQKPGLCSSCKTHPPPFKASRSWLVYEGPIRTALLKLKYYRNFSLGDTIASLVMPEIRKNKWPIDSLVPIPIAKKRLAERGYNQVGMIAFSLAAQAKWEYLPHALQKKRDTISQVGLSAQKRRENVKDAFSCVSEKVNGKTILLLDDITTTGATLLEGSKVLLDAGARDVYAFTITRVLTSR